MRTLEHRRYAQTPALAIPEQAAASEISLNRAPHYSAFPPTRQTYAGLTEAADLNAVEHDLDNALASTTSDAGTATSTTDTTESTS